MLFKRSEWSIYKFLDKQTFELGCGPVEMIEFMVGAKLFAFDPLDEYYSLLFKNLRSAEVQYLSKREDILLKFPQVVSFRLYYDS